MQLEYINPLAGLAMLVIGIFVMLFVHWIYGVTPTAVGLALIICYRKYLLQILGGEY
ncbi:MAG TPA: hypothetical protein VF172_05900 [Nitrososphaera sp.]